jgi:hypothetical protein
MSVVFARRAIRVGTHGLGTLEAISERTGRISVRNNEETEKRGFDFWEIRNVVFHQWWTKTFNIDRDELSADKRVALGLGGGHVPVVEAMNIILGFTVEQEVGDEGGSGLSSTGGTSVISFKLETVQYSLEKADEDTGINYLRSEVGDYFISEDLNTVIQRSDNTFLSVDTRSVDHGGSGGGAGNPVVSGAVSGNTMTLTLDDASTVDVDVTSLVVPDGITINSPNWFQQFASPGDGTSAAGSQINFTTHQSADENKNPYYWGTLLEPGREMVWTATGGPHDIVMGIWGGATTYAPEVTGATDDSFHSNQWTKKLRFFGDSDYVYGAGSAGFDLPSDKNHWYEPGEYVLSLRYDSSDNKLKLYEVSTGIQYLITTANVAEDGTNKTISAAFGYPNSSTSSTAIPQPTDRDYMYEFVHRTSSLTDERWRNGLIQGDVLKHTYSLRPGFKLKFTTTTDSGNDAAQWHMFDYTGTATGQSNWQDATSASLKWTSTTQWTDSDNVGSWTHNTAATRMTSGFATTTTMPNVLVSWRYHPVTNVIDLWDEGNNEVLFTLDTARDGNPVYLHIASNAVSSSMPAANVPQSFALANHDYFDDEPNHGQSGLVQGYEDWFVKVGPRAGMWAWDRRMVVFNETPQIYDRPHDWGRKLRPGESFIFRTNITQTNGFLYIGVGTHTAPYMDSSDNSNWTKYLRFDQNEIYSKHGMNWATGVQSYDSGGGTYGSSSSGYWFLADGSIHNSDDIEIEYRASDNRLVFWHVTDGRFMIASAMAAEDGNPVSITVELTNLALWSMLPSFTAGGNAWYVQFANTSGSTQFYANTSYIETQTSNTYTPLKWGRLLHPGEELAWTHSNQRNDSAAHHFGILKPTTTSPGSMSASNLWLKNLSIQGAKIRPSGTDGTVGFDLDTYQASTLASAVSIGNTTITLTDGTDYPAEGSVLIESETINYSAKSGNVLTCTAATAAHASGLAVTNAGFFLVYPTDTFALRYDPEDYKLKFYKTTGSVDQLITTATVAEDGSGVTISEGGNSPNMPGITHQKTPVTLGSGVSRWYSRHGERAGRGLVDNIDHGTGSDTPAVWGQWLKQGEEVTWTHPSDYASGTAPYFLGGWTSGQTSIGNDANDEAPWAWRFRFESDEVISTGNGDDDAKGIDLTSDYMGLVPGTTRFALRYDHADNKVRLYNITSDNEILIATTSSALDGNPFQLVTAGHTARRRVTLDPKRNARWTMVREVHPGYNDHWYAGHWKNGIGGHTVFRGNTKLHPGYRIRWTMPTTARNYAQIGIWNESTNESLGYTTSSGTANWGWNFFTHSEERIYEQDDEAWTFNSAATGYNAAPYIAYGSNKVIELRYNADNSMTLYNVTAGEVWATKDVDLDGTPLQLWYGNTGNSSIASSDLADDFFGSFGIGVIDAGDDTNWYQLYQGAGNGSSAPGPLIGTTLPPAEGNPYRFGTTLKRGYEFLFTASFNEETIDFGIWGGSTTYTPTSAGNSSLWTKKIRYGSGGEEIKHGTGNADTKGFDLTDDYQLSHGNTKLALRYDQTSAKLELWDRTDDRWKIITTASVAEDGNPVTISFANTTSGGGMPNFTVREHTWEIIAQVTAGADTSWRSGIPTDTVIRRTIGLHPGQKMKCTLASAWQNHFFGFDYTGTATGQTNVENRTSNSLKLTASEKIEEFLGFTINTLATRFESGDSTVAMGGAAVSFRYHTDNTFDLYDEDNEDVLFTKNSNMSGAVVFLHAFVGATITDNFFNTTWTDGIAFDNAWYKHGVAANWYQGYWYSPARFTGGTAVQKWGQYLYPGQELVWTHYQPTANTTYLGIRNAGNDGWIRNLLFGVTDVTNGTGFDLVTPYEESDNILLETDVGLGADELLLETGYKLVQEADTLGTKWSLRYDKGDNKLKLYSIATTTGIETLVTTANSAQDGSAITIHGAGAGHAWIFDHRYYGWEYVHQYVVLPWQNWRIDRPSANNELANDAVLRSLRGLNPGYYMRWTTGVSAQGGFFGKWKAANAATGLTSIENTSTNWEFGFKQNNQERYESLVGMTFNTSNSNYNAGSGDPYWQDPVPGTTQVQWRYHSVTNKLDLHDHTNNQVIATKTDDPDGTGIFLDYGNGVGLSLLTDDFLGGGDVTIAEATFAPTFTDAINYGDDGILHQGELISLDTTVPVGNRLILTPEFFGYNNDQSGVADSGPAGNEGWQESDVLHFGWQKATPLVGTNIGNSNSGWDIGVRQEMRGAGASHAARISVHSPGNATHVARDSRANIGLYTFLYYTLDRISTSSGRIMAFTTLEKARVGVAGDNTQFVATDSNYFDGGADTLALTSDFKIYIYSNAGDWTLPIVPCTELVSIPT